MGPPGPFFSASPAVNRYISRHPILCGTLAKKDMKGQHHANIKKKKKCCFRVRRAFSGPFFFRGQVSSAFAFVFAVLPTVVMLFYGDEHAESGL